MVRSLIWKEWREHAWKMAACLLILTVPMIWIRLRPPFSIETLVSLEVVFLAVLALTIWVAASTITSERATQRALEALPVDWGVVFVVKSVFGLLTLLGPLAIARAVAVDLFATNLPTIEFSDRYSISMMMAIAHLYLMILAVGMSARREGIAALTGVLVVLTNILITFWVLGVVSPSHSQVAMIEPLAAFGGPWKPESFVFAIQVAQCIVLWLIAAAHFRFTWRRQAVGRGIVVAADSKPERLPRMRGFVFGPLVWKEWREQRGVIFGCGLVGVILALVFFCLEIYRGSRARSAVGAAADALGFMVIPGTAVVSIILGVSGWAVDLEPSVHGFWQSRPISAARVYWIKFGVGLGGIAALFAAFALTALGLEIFASGQVPHEVTTKELWLYLAGIAPLYALVLTGSMLSSLLFRRPMYAATVAVGAAMIFSLAGFPILMATRYVSVTVVQDLALIGVTVVLARVGQKALERNWRLL